MQNIKKDHRNLVGKSSDTGSCARVRRTPQDKLLKSELSLSLRDIRFSKQEFPADTLVSHIKYDYPRSLIFELYYIYNKNVEQVYNEMHTGKW